MKLKIMLVKMASNEIGCRKVSSDNNIQTLPKLAYYNTSKLWNK